MLDADGLDGVRADDAPPRARVLTPPPLPDDAPAGVAAAPAIDASPMNDVAPAMDAAPAINLSSLMADLARPVPSLRPRTPRALLAVPARAVAAAVVAWLVAAHPGRVHVAVAPTAPPASRPIVTPLAMPIDAIVPARFDFNARTPHGDARDIAAAVAPCGDGAVVLTGHADAVGSRRANDEIALARADAVRALLVEAGVDAARVHIVSAGATEPIASNASARGRRENRRVTLHCEPHNGGEP